MPKFLEELDGASGLSRTNQVLRSVLSGDIESGRQSLARALEKLGYHVISEDPLYARRGARRWARYYCSFDIIDYPRKLSIGLKALSSNATLATFDYAAEHFGAFSSRGDRQTLRLEAEAIIALATQSSPITLCTACGTKQSDDSRFCRICGAPNVGEEPAELEVLRLSAGARAGHHRITAAVIWARAPLMTALFALIAMGASGGGLTAGLLLAMVGNLIILFFVLHASRKTLSPDVPQQQVLPVDLSPPDVTNGTAAFSAYPGTLSEQKYVTEGTTGLLPAKPKKREKELVYRRGRDTSPTG